MTFLERRNQHILSVLRSMMPGLEEPANVAEMASSGLVYEASFLALSEMIEELRAELSK